MTNPRLALRSALRNAPFSPLVGKWGGAGFSPISLFANGEDGFLFDFSKTDQLFQTSLGQTAVAVDADPIGLALEAHAFGGKTFAAELAAQPELIVNGTFDTSVTGWSDLGQGAVGSVGGRANRTIVSLNQSGGYYQDTSVPIGQTVRISADQEITAVGSGGNGGLRIYDGAGFGTQLNDATRTTIGSNTAVRFVRSAAGTLRAYLFGETVSAPPTTTFYDNVSEKLIPGNHGLQATTSARPFWKTPNFARFDGADDNLLTSLIPSGSAYSIAFKAKIGSGSKVIMGCQTGTDVGNLFMNTSGGGLLAGGYGTVAAAALTGGSSILGQTGVGILTGDGSTLCLYWNGTLISTQPQAGSPTSSVPITIGCRNQNGTPAFFADADFHKALAIKRALTPAEVLNLTNNWNAS